jgi:Leucine-rich repeat (LRR) protein
MYCTKCGNQMHGEDLFCAKCGNKTRSERKPNIVKPYNPKPPTIKKPKLIISTKLRNYILIGAGVLVLLIGTVFITLALVKNKGENTVIDAESSDPLISIDTKIKISDPVLEAQIRELIDKPSGDLDKSDLSELKYLSIFNTEIGDLSGIQHLPSLNKIRIELSFLEQINISSLLKTLEGLDEDAEIIVAIENKNEDYSILDSIPMITGFELVDPTNKMLNEIGNLNISTDITSLRVVGDITHDFPVNNLNFIERMLNLESLNLWYCIGIQDYSSISKLHSLTDLYIGNSDLSEVSFLAPLLNLRRLGLFNGSKLTDISSLSLLTELEEITFSICENIEDISSVTELTKLTKLTIPAIITDGQFNILCDMNPNIEELGISSYNVPQNFTDLTPVSKLTKLKNLNLSGCTGLKNIGAISKIDNLEEFTCPSDLSNDDLSIICNSQTSLTRLDIHYNETISDITSLGKLTNLTNLTVFLGSKKDIEGIDALSSLSKLTRLSLRIDNSLQNLDALSNATELIYLQLFNCLNLTNIHGISNNRNLDDLTITDCPEIDDFSTIKNFKKLNKFSLTNSKYIQNLEFLSESKNLFTCSILKAPNLVDVSSLSNSSNLSSIKFKNNGMLSDISSLSSIDNLKFLTINECPNITDTSSLDSMPDLTIIR